MRVELAYAEPAREILIGFDARDGATVLECVERSGLFDLVPALRDARLGFAVFGRRVEPADVLSEGDRIEVLRPLEVDPKEARRLRARRRAQGDRPVSDESRPRDRRAPPPGTPVTPPSRRRARGSRE